MAKPKVLPPLTKKQLWAAAEQLATAYSEGEKEILRVLAQGNITDWKRVFLRQQLAQIRAITADLATTSAEWATYHVPTLYRYGMAVTDGRLDPPGLSKVAHPGEVTNMDLGLARMHNEAIADIGEALVADLDEAMGGIGRHIRSLAGKMRDPALREEALKAMQAGFVQGETGEQVSKRLLKALEKRGITSFVDDGGKRWNMTSYARMVARTTSREATAQGSRNRVIEAGYDLVRISTHAGSCELCAPWEGEVVSLTGATEGYPTLADAQAEGYNHPNCAHVELPYISEAGRL